MSQCNLIREMADNLFIHMRSIRARTISEEDRINRSIIDHMDIIEALESRDADLAARLVREHSLNLASHIKKHVNYLE
jgi:DNA-binding GntR family transcriptional regulator